MSQRESGAGSLERRVTIAGCLYWAAALTYYFVKFSQSPGGIPASLYGFAPFIIVFALAAVGVWMKPLAGFITAVAISGVSLILVGPSLGIAQSLSAEGLLFGGATANAVLFLVLFFSLFGFRETWRKGIPEGAKPFRIGRSVGIGAFVFLALFVAMGVAFGNSQNNVAANTGQADVVIASGSAYITNDRFYLPSIIEVRAGQSVTWKNLDTAPHTITSDSGLFQSGNIGDGATYTFTFAQPGTYHYICDYHPWMVGTIVVSSA